MDNESEKEMRANLPLGGLITLMRISIFDGSNRNRINKVIEKGAFTKGLVSQAQIALNHQSTKWQP